MDDLVARAAEARSRAYAPYSGYAVGAAIEAEDGRIWTGANVENVSYGLAMCAERVAVGAMVASGQRRLRRVAVATEDGGPPCGMCRQTLAEFAPDPEAVEVIAVSAAGEERKFRLGELLPHAFGSPSGARTKSAVE